MLNKPRDWQELEIALEIENKMLRAQLVAIEWVKFGRQGGQGGDLIADKVSPPSPELERLLKLGQELFPSFPRIPDYCENGFPVNRDCPQSLLDQAEEDGKLEGLNGK